MVQIPPNDKSTVRKLFDFYERTAGDWRRDHLGASVVGQSCNRALWYSFRWAVKKTETGRMLRLMERGRKEEEWVIEDLRSIGISVDSFDPETGKQFRFEAFGGHFSGSCDGLAVGFPEAPNALHVFECKTANEKNFKAISKNGVKAAKPEHYTQFQIYMHYFRERGYKVDRAFYVCVCKDTDDFHVERLVYDRDEAVRYMHRAESVVFSQNPLSRVSENPTWFECGFCNFKSVCHLEMPGYLERNCRTCLSSTPLRDGTWFCDLHEKTLSGEAQRSGCEKHLFIPSLLPTSWRTEDADVQSRQVFYRDRNGVPIVDGDSKLTIGAMDDGKKEESAGGRTDAKSV